MRPGIFHLRLVMVIGDRVERPGGESQITNRKSPIAELIGLP
jgi:hypothetical protein